MDLDLSDSARPVMPGTPIGGYIGLWEEDDVSFWRLPGEPPSMLGAGAMTRVDDETGRYRELCFLDPDSGLLVLRDREPGPGGAPVSQLVPLAPVTMEEAKAESLREDDGGVEWLGNVAYSAATRGEWLAVHRGSWEGPLTPVVVIELLHGTNGELLSAVRATPVPAGAEFWSDYPVAPGSDSQQIAGPASDKALFLAGPLVLTAFLTWGIHPLMLGMTFGPNPLGPWAG